MLTKRDVLRSAALAAVAASTTASPPRCSRIGAAPTVRGFFKAKDIAEAGFIYGLPIVMNYGVMYEYAVDRNSGQFKAPFNQIKNEPNVYTYKDTAVVTPNSDTPYSLLIYGLAGSAHRPFGPSGGSEALYSVMLCDGNTYNYGYIGSRTTGKRTRRLHGGRPGLEGRDPARDQEGVPVEHAIFSGGIPHPAL